MTAMTKMPDKWFDLAIVDPPYGINHNNGGGRYAKWNNDKHKWDAEPPKEEYFRELFRVSKNQIIWGANHYEGLPKTKGFIFWFKHQPVKNFSDGEYAWTSFQVPAKCFDYHYYGNINADTDCIKFHPTCKPIALYRWILKNYAPPQAKILDTHLGSGSIAIACYDMGFDLTAYEIDLDYYNAAVKRLENHKKQITFL